MFLRKYDARESTYLLDRKVQRECMLIFPRKIFLNLNINEAGLTVAQKYEILKDLTDISLIVQHFYPESWHFQM